MTQSRPIQVRRTRHRRASRTAAIAATLAGALLTLTACGGSSLNSSGSSGSSKSADCPTTKLAMNDWVGYTADAAVYTALAKKLGCDVQQVNVNEQVAWQGFSSGQVDAVIENWGHADLTKKYITQQKVAVDVGPTGNKGVIGWFVPPWMAKKYPDITNWKNLNKYASMFKTSESGGKGQLLDGSPSYVTNDAALVQNLKLNFKVVYAGSEAALISAFQAAEKNKTPLIGYFYEPHWLFAQLPLVQVQLPAYTTGCDAVAAKVACGYPPYVLNKVASKKWYDTDSPAVKLLKKFSWTNDDQNTVAGYIAKDKMSASAAADKWIKANPAKVKAMMP